MDFMFPEIVETIVHPEAAAPNPHPVRMTGAVMSVTLHAVEAGPGAVETMTGGAVQTIVRTHGGHEVVTGMQIAVIGTSVVTVTSVETETWTCAVTEIVTVVTDGGEIVTRTGMVVTDGAAVTEIAAQTEIAVETRGGVVDETTAGVTTVTHGGEEVTASVTWEVKGRTGARIAGAVTTADRHVGRVEDGETENVTATEVAAEDGEEEAMTDSTVEDVTTDEMIAAVASVEAEEGLKNAEVVASEEATRGEVAAAMTETPGGGVVTNHRAATVRRRDLSVQLSGRSVPLSGQRDRPEMMDGPPYAAETGARISACLFPPFVNGCYCNISYSGLLHCVVSVSVYSLRYVIPMKYLDINKKIE